MKLINTKQYYVSITKEAAETLDNNVILLMESKN